MSTLHTVNKSPFERNALRSCLGHISSGDSILMIEDAVTGARKGSSVASMVQEAMKTGKIYALAGDLAARGIKTQDVIDGIQLIDYSGFVDLVTSHDRTSAWL